MPKEAERCAKMPSVAERCRALDGLNRKIGNTKVMLAAQDMGRKWKMKQEKLSPYYTTRGEISLR